MNEKEKIKTYMQTMLAGEPVPLSDHTLGVYNGMELALSIIEGRPTFYIDHNKRYNAYDMETQPDYFL